MLSYFSIQLALAVYCLRDAFATNNGLGRRPPMGWSTWCTNGPCFQDVCTQDEVKSVVLSMNASGLQAAGWNWISFDDVSCGL